MATPRPYNPLSLHYLPDTPLETLGEQDALRHKELAEQISSTIRICPLPFTIGLDGEWGSGKTSVVYEVWTRLNTLGQTAFAQVYFDAWKYERDSLRRQFLIKAHEDLVKQKLLKEAHLSRSELYRSTTVQAPPKLDWNAINPFMKQKDEKLGGEPKLAVWVRFIILVGSVLALVLAAYLAYTDRIALTVLTGLIGGSGLTTVAGLIPRIFLVRAPTEHVAPMTSGEEFEKVFADWLKVSEVASRKLVVIVDNLDRCDRDQIIGLLGDIKTFLEPQNASVVFLLPVDERAIREALSKEYGPELALEYLRKFFNTTYRMPPPLWAETRDFATEKLKETNLIGVSGAADDEAARITTVILAAYANNPRRVIQFLNRLLSHWQQIQAAANAVKRPDIAKELGSIAKALALREKWPDLASRIEQSPSLLSQFQDQALQNEEVDDRGLSGFLRATQAIPLERPRLLLTGKADIFEVELPDAEQLREYLIGVRTSPLRDLLTEEAWMSADVQHHVVDLVLAEARELSAGGFHEGLATLIDIVGPSLKVLDVEERPGLAHELAKISIPEASYLARYGESVVDLATWPPTGAAGVGQDLILRVLRVATPSERARIMRRLVASDVFDTMKPTLLELSDMLDDPEVLEALTLEDSGETQFWDDATVVQHIEKSALPASELAPGGIAALTRLADTVALKGYDVGVVPLSLLARTDLSERLAIYKWVARTPTLWVEPSESADLLPLYAEADRLRGNAEISAAEFVAICAQLFPHGDAASQQQFQPPIESFLKQVPNPDLHEMTEDWFPPIDEPLPSWLGALLVDTEGEPDVDELRTRMEIAKQWSSDWSAIARLVAELLPEPSRVPRAAALVLAAIEVEGTTPGSLLETVMPAGLAEIGRRGRYVPAIGTLLTDMVLHPTPDHSLAEAARTQLRGMLIQQLFRGSGPALETYSRLDVSAAERAEDQGEVISVLATGRDPLSADSQMAIDFATDRLSSALRSTAFGHLLALATGTTLWELGLTSLVEIPWSPGTTIMLNGQQTLISTAVAQRSVDQTRAAQTYKAAIKLVGRFPRQQAWEALKAAASGFIQDGVIGQDEADQWGNSQT